MKVSSLLLLVLLIGGLGFAFSWVKARRQAKVLGGIRHLHSLPQYYGFYALLWILIPALLLIALWSMSEHWLLQQMVLNRLSPELVLAAGGPDLVVNTLVNLSQGLLAGEDLPTDLIEAGAYWARADELANYLITLTTIILMLVGFAISYQRIHPDLQARSTVEKFVLVILGACAGVAILTTIGIVMSVLFESVKFFKSIPLTDFVFGLEWSPQTALRADQQGSSGLFGALPLFVGTLLISSIAMVIAVPVGLMSAVYLAEYANPWVRQWAKPILEILAGIPTVVYGFFAALTVAPFLRQWGESFGISVASESALAAGAVMGIMIIPFVSSLADDVITAVPRTLRDGSLAMGATRSETMVKVIFPAALPGIMSGILLAVSRAIGETMIVVMAAGMAAKMTANPLEAVTTVTVQIVTLLTGDQEFDSPKTLAAFALGLMLFVVTLTLNFIALHIVKKYREQYD